MLKEFVIGRLFSEGIINSLGDIQEVDIGRDTARVELVKTILGPLEAQRGLIEFSCVAGNVEK